MSTGQGMFGDAGAHHHCLERRARCAAHPMALTLRAALLITLPSATHGHVRASEQRIINLDCEPGSRRTIGSSRREAELCSEVGDCAIERDQLRIIAFGNIDAEAAVNC